MKKHSERIIHLDDMLSYIAGQWKRLVVIAFAAGILFGGIGLYKANKSYKSSLEKKPAAKIEINISGMELIKVDTILYLEKMAAKQKEYNDRSILMRINPHEKQTACIKYQFLASEDTALELMESRMEQGAKAYQDVFDGAEIYEYMKTFLSLETDEKYIRELIHAKAGPQGILLITVSAPDAGMAQGMREAVKNYLQERNREILKNYKDLNVKVDSEYTAVVSDMELFDTQAAQYNKLCEIQKQIETSWSELPDSAREYLEAARPLNWMDKYESGQKFYKESAGGQEGKKDNRVYKAGAYAVKRMLLFLCIYIACCILKYMFSFKLVSVDDLQDMYGVKVIDVLSTGDTDRLALTAEKLSASAEDDGRIMLTGSEKEQLASQVIDRLRQELEEKGISVKIGAEIGDIASIKTVKECNNIILVESIGKSRYSKIKNVLDLVWSLNKDVKGAVIIKNNK